MTEDGRQRREKAIAIGYWLLVIGFRDQRTEARGRVTGDRGQRADDRVSGVWFQVSERR
jgi:hypothetical protein